MALVEKQFTSNQNKGLLWKLMCDNDAFNGIPNENSTVVRTEFENKINTLSKTITNADQLVALNKRTIVEMMQMMDKYRVKNSKNINSNQATTDSPLHYNAADLLQQRQKAFETDLKQKQIDFERFNAKPVPDKIDFADKLDAPMGAEMDRILAEQIALREKQISMVLSEQDKNAASKWLNNSGESVKPSSAQITIYNEPATIPLITVDVKEIFPIERKKVNFIMPAVEAVEVVEVVEVAAVAAVAPVATVAPIAPVAPVNSMDDFMHLLKKVPTVDINEVMNINEVININEVMNINKVININEMLTAILAKQDQILALLLEAKPTEKPTAN
jgi:hypothetical protein